jgi:hypothetical protein
LLGRVHERLVCEFLAELPLCHPDALGTFASSAGASACLPDLLRQTVAEPARPSLVRSPERQQFPGPLCWDCPPPQQQDACPHQFPRRRFARRHHNLQILPLRFGQCHPVTLLHGTLLGELIFLDQSPQDTIPHNKNDRALALHLPHLPYGVVQPARISRRVFHTSAVSGWDDAQMKRQWCFCLSLCHVCISMRRVCGLPVANGSVHFNSAR